VRDPFDDPAVRHFVTHEYRRAVGAVALVVGDRDIAEDAVQEAMARALHRRHREDALRDPTAWIIVVALNAARRRFRRTATEQRAIERLPIRATESDDHAEPACGEHGEERHHRPVHLRATHELNVDCTFSVDLTCTSNVGNLR
jgi:predicted RNA polymerase sigma factor